jgi:2-dehydropantoate 2-reductase
MNIAVIGAGAVGLYFGARLQQVGHDVRFLLRRDFEAITAKGLTVTSPTGDFYLPIVKGYRDTREIGPVDLVLVALKTFDNGLLPSLVRPLLEEHTAILTLQNGLGNEELLADLFGAERILGGVAIIGSNRGEPGIVHHQALGTIRLGEITGARSERAVSLAGMFSAAAVPCEAVADLRRARWEKLVWNITFNGLCTLANQTPGYFLAHPATRILVRELMAEVIAGANAQGLSESILSEAFIEDNIDRTIRHTSDYRPSMMIDRAEGRQLELDAIYRIPLEHAARQGVHMVRVEMLHALLAVGENRLLALNINDDSKLLAISDS